MAKFTTAQQNEVKRLQSLGFTEAEAIETVLYDDDVEHNRPTEFDLTAEQQKVAKKYTNIGSKKHQTGYQFTKRERKPNEAKRELIAMLFDAVSTAEMEIVTPVVTNVERQIDFEYCGQSYSIALTQHRAKKE